MGAGEHKILSILTESDCDLPIPTPLAILQPYHTQISADSTQQRGSHQKSKDVNRQTNWTFHNFVARSEQDDWYLSIPCEAIGCKRTLRGPRGLKTHMTQCHTYYLEIFYTCPVQSCGSRYREKHLLLTHMNRVHLNLQSRHLDGLLTWLEQNNEIYGYYADSPVNAELKSCPVEGCNTLLIGLPLLYHMKTKHCYMECPRDGCNTFTNSNVALDQHLARDHQS